MGTIQPMVRLLLLTIAAVALPSLCPAQAGQAPKSALDKQVLEQYLRHLYVWGPQITVRVGDPKASELPGFVEVPVTASAGPASQTEVLYVSKDGQKIIRGQIMDVNQNPFRAEIERLKGPSQPAKGTAGAPVVLTVFSDFQCPACAEEARMLRENLLQTYPTQVRLYYRDFPLTQIHPWAKQAAVIGQCVFKAGGDEAFWRYHDWMFANQALIGGDNLRAKVNEFLAGDQNLDALQLNQCAETKDAEAAIDKALEDGRAIGIQSTPTIFVNGRKIPGHMDWPRLKQIIDHEIDYQKVAKNAGDDCGCEVKLPGSLQ